MDCGILLSVKMSSHNFGRGDVLLIGGDKRGGTAKLCGGMVDEFAVIERYSQFLGE